MSFKEQLNNLVDSLLLIFLYLFLIVLIVRIVVVLYLVYSGKMILIIVQLLTGAVF